MLECLTDFLKRNEVEYKGNVNFKELSTIRLGGVAPLVIYPSCEDKLISVIRYLKNRNLQFRVIGNMSNLLPPDTSYDGILILTKKMSRVTFNGRFWRIEAGGFIPFLAKKLGRMGYSGLEELSGIPATLGGMIVNNAGAFSKECSDVVKSVRCYDVTDDRVTTLSREECLFSYRSSIFKKKPFVVLSGELFLLECKGDILSEIEKYKDIRKRTQPVGQPSLGSTFKRPSAQISAARLIDLAGLKGTSLGGMAVSEKHAGFIVNLGGGTAKDYITLSDYVSDVVFDKYSVRLSREVEIL